MSAKQQCLKCGSTTDLEDYKFDFGEQHPVVVKFCTRCLKRGEEEESLFDVSE